MRMPTPRITLHQLLLSYIWPFGLFRDASVGTALERWAAYQYNREQRVYLPVYAIKWTVLCAVWLTGAVYFELSWKASASLWLRAWYMSAGVLFVGSLCVLMVIVVHYLYFIRVEPR